VAAPAVPGVVTGLAPVAPGLAPVVVLDPPAAVPLVPEAGVALGLPAEEPGVAAMEGATLGATAPWASPLEHMTTNAAPSTMSVAAEALRLWRRRGGWLCDVPTGRPPKAIRSTTLIRTDARHYAQNFVLTRILVQTATFLAIRLRKEPG
jgi:hypothetical protein